jgi:hypothetical protein
MHPENDSFHVPARSGRADEQVRCDVLDRLAAWIEHTIATTPVDVEPV